MTLSEALSPNLVGFDGRGNVTLPAEAFTLVHAAARAYVRLIESGQTLEAEDCIKEHPGHSSLEVFDLDPGIYLVAPMSAIEETPNG